VNDPAEGGVLPEKKYPWRYRTLNLRSRDGWEKLVELLSGDRGGSDGGYRHLAATNICRTLSAHKVTAALVEFPHRDRDFNAEYLAFHARQFRAGTKDCTRVHFFYSPSQDIDHIMMQKVVEERKRAGQLRGLADYGQGGGAYRGFCVLRPTEDVPIGYTVIARPPRKSPLERTLWAKYSTHILGQEFCVFGFPFIEQDGRTGACAQAAVWMALRYIWAAENGLWRSVPALNEVATSDPDIINSLSVPPGSGGLHAGDMMRAVRHADRIPHYFSSVPALQDGHLVVKWKNDVDPIAIACRYLDSNIPVILLVGHMSSRTSFLPIANPKETPPYELLDIQDGHALTAVGYYGDMQKTAVAPEGDDHLHLAQWVDGLIVHNDQVGPYLNLPRSHADQESDDDEGEGKPVNNYTCADILGLIVPLPDEVFLRADKAEEYAWIFVTEMADECWKLYLSESGTQPQKPPYPLDPKTLVARTFLTRGFDHYQWLTKARAHSEVLKLAASLHHSHFIWVTEFYSLKEGKPDVDDAVAHIVADATAVSESVGKAPYQGFLFGHLPGRCFAVLTGASKMAMKWIPDDHVCRAFEFQNGPRAVA
jgi:hypothetical protein